VPGEDNSAVDLAEWYVKGDGEPWGPFDVAGIRSLAAQGPVTASTLVSRDGDGVWMRLKDAVPAWECALQPAAEPEPPDPPLHVFYARRWVSLVGDYVAFVLGLLLFVFLTDRHDWSEMDWGETVLSVITIAAVPALFALLGDRERVEVTSRVVRLVSAGRYVSELPISELDRDRRRTGVFSGITGSRMIRSTSGKKLIINRRAYKDEDYAEIMRLLQLEAD